MAAIELQSLAKHYGDVRALNGLDLAVEEGEIFGFLGPNGAGKSTTIDVLMNYVFPTAGSARVFDLDVVDDSVAVRRRVGVLPDAYHVYDRLTGREHVELAIRSKDSDDDPAAILERVGIADAADRRAGGYSKGMKQRLVLGMALVGQPDLLILDEPTTGLDPSGAREIRAIIREERDRGATVFFSSHILEQVEAVCDRVAILNEGDLVTVDTIDGLREAAGTGVTLTVSVDVVPDDALAAVEAAEGVRTVDADGETLTITLETNGSKGRVLHALEKTGASVLDFETIESSLEDLFIRFTGESTTANAGPTADATTGAAGTTDAVAGTTDAEDGTEDDADDPQEVAP